MKKIVTGIIVVCVVLSFVSCTTEEKDYMQEDTLVQESQELSEEDQAIVDKLENTELETLKASVINVLADNYWPSAMIPETSLETIYGIDPEWYDDYLGEIPLISSNMDTFILIRAKEEYITQIEEALNAYREDLIANESQNPMNIGKIKASRIESIHTIVCYVQLGGDTTSLIEQDEDVMIAYCLEQNEHAIDAIVKTLFP